MRLTLAEVVSEEEFGLVVRSGSPAALARPVAGAETVEAARPEELTARDHIMFTTGVRLRGNPALQRQIVVESEARGVAALGFGVGLVFRSIPRALLEEARARDFPVLEVPFEVPFRDIIAFVNRAHLSDDFYSLKRTVALQNTLLGAMGGSRPGEATSVLVGPVVEVAERLLRLIDLSREAGVMEERVRRGELLNDLLDEQRAREVSPERLELFGFSAKGPWRVALLAVGSARDEVVRLVADSAASTGTPHLIGPHHGHVALVVEGEGALLEVWTANLAAAGVPVRAALGRAVEAPSRLVDSRGDALLALDFLGRTGAAPGRVLRFEDFELVDALLSAADPAELQARVDLVLDPLRDHPQLLESLAAYLDADQNVNAAAEALHVHPNSLRYRLGRVEELLGRSVRSPATLADLYVALRAETRFESL